jgi:PAS domain S-box-containing protein
MSEAPVSVLYVNDEPELLEFAVTGLEREFARLSVRTATSVEEGLKLFRGGNIDCIVSDYHMPDQTGIDFLRKIREMDADMPFILFTNTGSEQVASDAISAGVSDYLVRETLDNQYQLLATKILSQVEKHRTAQRAAQTDRRLRELSEVSNDALWVFSPEWDELLFINSAHERLFGQSQEALRSNPTSFLDKIHPDDIDRVKHAMDRASNGELIQVEYRIRKSDSVQLWVESRCQPIMGEDGDVLRLIGMTRDVTDRKVREEALAEKNKQLEEFTGTVAHDIRNPLSIASGHLELARQECDSEHLAPTEDALARIEQLLSDLLELAKAGETIGDLSEATLAEIATESFRDISDTNASLEIASSRRLLCNPLRLREALGNLFRNAIEHNTEPVTITVGTLSEKGFYIEDDGVGIPDSDWSKVFESGYTTIQNGTGFGLAIVKQIIDAHGWDIKISASSAGGARFELTGIDQAG